MNILRLAIIPAVVTISLPLTANADSMWHSTPGEAGWILVPEHFESTKNRADVLADVQAARKDGTWAILQRGAALPTRSTAPSKTRQQVIAEMRAESPEEKRARLEIYGGN
jgi:hypothetical protein